MKKGYYVLLGILVVLVLFAGFRVIKNRTGANSYQTFEHDLPEPIKKMNLDCPEGYIPIPGDMELETKDFCVAKYEMKIFENDDGSIDYNSSNIPESRAGGTPWKNLTQVQSKAECKSLGKEYDLISNAEWMTIAYNIESVRSNWDDNKEHPNGTTIARINIGHSCRKGMMGADCRKAYMDVGHGVPYSGEGLAASEDDNEACYGYVAGDYEVEKPICDSETWNLFRRTHLLNNGAVIWDFSGNVWDWIDWAVLDAKDRARKDGEINGDFLEINEAEPTEAMPSNSFQSKNKNLLSSRMNGNTLGRYHPTAEEGVGAAMRGGNYMQGEYNNGIYSLGMGYSPDSDHIMCQIGFRCVYRPTK
jgi:hypothetical protein